MLAGSSASTYTGTTTVGAPRWELDGPNAVAIIPGDLVVGDGTDGARLELENSGQIADASDITVNANATLDFNGHDDTVGSMDIDGGTVTAGAAFRHPRRRPDVHRRFGDDPVRRQHPARRRRRGQ